jgi:HlyD family secretion protein
MRRAVIAIPALLYVVACAKKPEKEEAAPAPVQVTSVTQATIRRIVEGDGVLYPRDQASVTAKVSAPVQKFYVSRGDHVKQGQMLVMLENRDLSAAAAEGKGALEQAESNLRVTQGASVPDAVTKAETDLEAARDTRDNAKKVLDSRQQLFDQGALARRQVDESQLAYSQAVAQYRAADEHLKALQSVSNEEQVKSASAQVQSAKAHYESLEVQAGYARVTSPIAGIVADRPINAGEMASAGTPLITIVDISRVVARVDVPQSEAGAIKLGQTASITQPGNPDPIEGTVTVVSPSADANTTTVQIWIQIENPGERLRPGSAVHASIATEIVKAATVVPAAAILPGEEGGTSVLTISSDSIAHRRAVKLGVREGSQIQILNGVSPGEEVVTVGGMGLDDKAKVKIVTTAVEESDDDEDNAPDASDKTGKPKPDSQDAQKKDQQKK